MYTKSILYTLLTIIMATTLSSCQMPTDDDDYSVIPATNNPSITRDKTKALPGMN